MLAKYPLAIGVPLAANWEGTSGGVTIVGGAAVVIAPAVVGVGGAYATANPSGGAAVSITAVVAGQGVVAAFGSAEVFVAAEAVGVGAHGVAGQGEILASPYTVFSRGSHLFGAAVVAIQPRIVGVGAMEISGQGAIVIAPEMFGEGWIDLAGLGGVAIPAIVAGVGTVQEPALIPPIVGAGVVAGIESYVEGVGTHLRSGYGAVEIAPRVSARGRIPRPEYVAGRIGIGAVRIAPVVAAVAARGVSGFGAVGIELGCFTPFFEGMGAVVIAAEAAGVGTSHPGGPAGGGLPVVPVLVAGVGEVGINWHMGGNRFPIHAIVSGAGTHG